MRQGAFLQTTLLACLALWLKASVALSAGSSDICAECSCTSKVINCSSMGFEEIPFIGNRTEFESLDFNNNRIKHVPASPLRGIAPTLHVINLGNNLITTIEDGAFADMPALSAVVLSNNRLSTLPEHLFNHSRPATLDLSYNYFTEVPSDTLRTISLDVLDLKHNPLHSLPDSAFENVTNIKELDLSYCNLSSENFGPRALDKNIFGYLLKLTLDGNYFPELNKSFFADFVPSLVKLSMNNCGIRTLKHGSFSIFTHLQTLSLDYNEIEVLEKNLFFGIVLTTLSLEYCRITTIRRGAFNKSSIEVLKLNHNRLNRIRGIDFDGLYSMDELELSYNNISIISGRPFSGQKYIFLANNQLVDEGIGNPNDPSSPEPFANLSHLRVLDISRNQLKKLPKLHTARSELQKLFAHSNQIMKLTGTDFSGMSSLVILDLSNNSIAAMDNDTFNDCVSLYQLNLAYNHFSQLPSLKYQSDLVKLLVSHSQMETLPSDLCTTCPQLQQLSVEHNQLIYLANLSNCKSLYEVLAQQNDITALSASTFKDVVRLHTIDLSYNRIGSLEYGSFQDLINLKDLYLDNNAISELPLGIFDNLVNLKRVDLNNNKIQSLPEKLFQNTTYISDIRLNNNMIKDINPTAFPKSLMYLQRLNLSSNPFSQFTMPEGGFPSLIYLSLANVPNMYQAPDAERCACRGVVQLEFTYPYHCCLWQALVKPEYLKPTTTPPIDPDDNITMPVYNPTFPSIVTAIPPYQPGDGTDINKLKPVLEWFATAYNLDYKILPGPIIIWIYKNASTIVYTDLTPPPPTAPSVPESPSVICYPRGDALTPCDNLMNPWPLRAAIWFVLVLALLGNGSVLFVMLASKDKIKVPQFFISNLAFADFCLGIYLAFLACVDARTYGSTFYQSALEWQMGAGCSAAGFIAVFSSQLSCCMLVSVTLERVYTIYNSPKTGITMSTAIFIALLCWLISFIFAALPLIGVNSYSKVAVCLPYLTSEFGDKIYIGMLLTTTVCAFLIILVSYAVILCTVFRSPAIGQSRKETVKVLRKTVPLVITNFLCWFPIVVIGYSALFDHALIDTNQAKWLVVLVYPFNACANPFWYAIFTKNFRHRIRSMFKHTTGYLQSPNAVGLRIHLGQDSSAAKNEDIGDDEKRRKRQSQRSHSVVAYTHTAVFGTLQGRAAPVQPYMGRRASLPAVLRQSEHTVPPAASLLFQMEAPSTNNSLPDVFEATNCHEAETSLTESSDSGRLHKSLSVLKEMPEAEGLDDDKKSTVSTQSDNFHDAHDHVAETHCCTQLQVAQDLRSLDSCCSSAASNATTDTSLGSTKHLTSVVPRATTMSYTLHCSTSLIGSETEV